MSFHITPFTNIFIALKKLKDLYDSHLELEVVQLMIKLFTLELDLALASKIRATMHDVEANRVKKNVPLKTFLKALYPTYFNYLESLQASVKIKEISFDSLVWKFTSNGSHLFIATVIASTL